MTGLCLVVLWLSLTGLSPCCAGWSCQGTSWTTPTNPRRTMYFVRTLPSSSILIPFLMKLQVTTLLCKCCGWHSHQCSVEASGKVTIKECLEACACSEDNLHSSGPPALVSEHYLFGQSAAFCVEINTQGTAAQPAGQRWQRLKVGFLNLSLPILPHLLLWVLVLRFLAFTCSSICLVAMLWASKGPSPLCSIVQQRKLSDVWFQCLVACTVTCPGNAWQKDKCGLTPCNTEVVMVELWLHCCS